MNLVQKNGKIRREDGNPKNAFSFVQPGDYQVTVKTLDYIESQSTCGFKIFKPCPMGSSRRGAYVAFIIDNSESHSTSDCPKAQNFNNPKVKRPLKQCMNETSREKSAINAVSILGNLNRKNPESVSFVAFSHFPNDDSNLSPRWLRPETESAVFKSQLGVLRYPKGVTPYIQGLESALRLFGSVKDDKQKVLVFITDGFPTDKNPKNTMTIARKIQALKVKIISVMITGKSNQEVLKAKHKGFMENFPENWVDGSYQNNMQAYYRDLLGDGLAPGLLRGMSDTLVFLEDSTSLNYEIQKIVSTRALACE